MNQREELELIITLIKKYNLPLSPILEFAVKERIGDLDLEERGSTIVQEEHVVGNKDLEDYKRDFSNLSVGNAKGKRLPHKAILLISIIKLIENDEIAENRIELGQKIASAFALNWSNYFWDVKQPNVWMPFWYLKTEPFWHFEPNDNEELLQGLLKFGGHPSINQMRHVIKFAYLDDALFEYLQDDESREALKEILEITYICNIYNADSPAEITTAFSPMPKYECWRESNRSTGVLRIWVNDHEYIQEKNATQTMIKAINLAGPERVAALYIPIFGEYLVQKNWHKEGKYADRQRELNDGWLLQTCGGNVAKKRHLEWISDLLGLGWCVELV